MPRTHVARSRAVAAANDTESKDANRCAVMGGSAEVAKENEAVKPSTRSTRSLR